MEWAPRLQCTSRRRLRRLRCDFEQRAVNADGRNPFRASVRAGSQSGLPQSKNPLRPSHGAALTADPRF